MTTTNDLKNGMVLNIDGQLWTVTKFQHVNPGKGAAFVRTKLKSVLTGKVLERTFNAGVKVEIASVDRRSMQFLYRDGDHFVFMDSDTYEQLELSSDVVGDAANFLLSGQESTVAMHDGKPLYVELPAAVVLEVTHTEPGVQGSRATSATKPATLETGYEVQVPLFVDTGTKLKIDTRTGEYLGRVS
ncbi:MAG: elongation factor P [Chloroflexota bacterium]|nr:elongation factor P [Chloroflexota bacterium]